MPEDPSPSPVPENTEIGVPAKTTAWMATPIEAAEFARVTGFALLPTYMERMEGGGFSKRPRPGCMWKEESTSDPAEVKLLWEKYGHYDPEQRSMIAIHCGKSKIFVFDEDDPEALTGDFRRLMDECETMTLVRRSVSRGNRHAYFRQPELSDDLSVLDSCFEGGEVKGDGYVAVSSAPPIAGVLPMPAPKWVLDLCTIGKTVIRTTGGFRARVRTEDLDAWVTLHDVDPVVSDPSSFLYRPIERFWKGIERGHRRQVCRDTAMSMFIEAMAGCYRLSDAVESLLEAYRSSREGTSKPWSRSRQEDFAMMWTGLMNAYDEGRPVSSGSGPVDLVQAVEDKRALLGDSSSLSGIDDWMTDEALEDVMSGWTAGTLDDINVPGVSPVAMMVASDPVDGVPPEPEIDTPVAPSAQVATEMVERVAETVQVTERDVEPVSHEIGAPAPSTGSGSGRGARIELDAAAFYGPHGDFVRELVPFTEADPAAMLLTTMAYYGAWLGKSRWIHRGSSDHSPSIQAVIIGQSSIARKGTSHAMVRRAWEPVMKASAAGVDEDDSPAAVFPMGPKPLKQLTGVASGEALIDLMSTPGTRAVMFEEEFVQMLRRIGRQGSTLGTVMRSVFDQKTLETHSRGSGTVTADGDLYSLSFLGHATDDELLSSLSASEIYGGSANRMLWVRAHPQRPLPFEQRAPEKIFDDYRRWLGVSRHGGTPSRREVPLSRSVESEWERIYLREAEPQFGLYGAVSARGPVNILRLALNISCSVGELEIGLESLLAADAIWRYCQQTAWLLFGLGSGDEQVDSMTRSLIEVYADINQDPWLSTKEIHSMFGSRYATIADRAMETGLIKRVKLPAMDRDGRPKKGRPTQFWMLSDFAADRLKLRRRAETPTDLLDASMFGDV